MRSSDTRRGPRSRVPGEFGARHRHPGFDARHGIVPPRKSSRQQSRAHRRRSDPPRRFRQNKARLRQSRARRRFRHWSSCADGCAGDASNNLTRRANHWHSGIIARIFKSPRGEIRRGFFHLEIRIGRRPARHDATSSHAPRLSVVSEPPSEPLRITSFCRHARTCRACVASRFCTKNAEIFGKECRRHARNVFTERSRLGRPAVASRCRACHRISAMMHLRHVLTLLVLLGWQISMIAPEAPLGVGCSAALRS